jgi:Mycobacterium membrane protein
VEATVRRQWIPIVVAVACLVGGAAVYRLYGLLGADNAALVGGARSEKIIEINPKTVTYQLFGPSNTSGR